MKVFFVGNVYNLVFPVREKRVISLLDGVNISNKFPILSQTIADFKKLSEAIGSIQGHRLTIDGCYIWTIMDSDNLIKEEVNDSNRPIILNALINWFSKICSNLIDPLWLLDDCACFVDNFIGQILEPPQDSFQFITNRYMTTANGSNQSLTLNEGLIRKWTELMTIYSKFIVDIGFKKMDGLQIGQSRQNPQSSRLERALSLLKEARLSPGLSQKIANYIVTLESLLSVSSTEVTHKVAERAAIYTVNNPGERFEVYKFIKDVYGVRSKYMHGQIVTQSKEVLEEYSIRIDLILRTIINKIMNKDMNTFLIQENKKKPGHRFEEKMINMTLGNPF